MGDAWRRRTGLLDAPERSERQLAKHSCGVFCGRKLSSARSDPGTPSARGMALLRLTPLDGHGLRQALKQAKAA